MIQYADDTIAILQGNESQLILLKGILEKISQSSGLKVNYHKSCLVPINIDQDRATALANTFGSIVGSFPFTYLGLPMGLTKPLVKDFAPLICRIERRMSATSQFLSQAGRLQLVNSVISSLPTYHMCSLKLPVTVVEIIDKYRKNCLWRGREFRKRGYNLAAWELVQKPKQKGGLGVTNLSLQNEALLLKHLDKFYRREDVQWVNLIWQRYYHDTVPHLAKEKGSFWWKDILRLNTQYRAVAICTPNKGDTISFWYDIIDGVIHSAVYPNLMSYAKDAHVSLWKLRRNSEDLLDCFKLPMSRAAYNEFLQLQNKLDLMTPIRQEGKDKWVFIWGQQEYASSRYYQYSFKFIRPHRTILWIWKTKCVPKIKVFAWLLLNDRLNTRNILRRRKKFLQSGYNCVLCQNGVEETSEHLFFDCPSASSRWFSLGITWEENANIHQKLHIAKQAFSGPFFMEIFLIGAWCLWNERNNLIFNSKIPSLGTWKRNFKDEVMEHLIRIKPSLHQSILSWLYAL